jgi:hypothetical protein
MRTLLKIITITVALYISGLIAPQKAQAQVTFQVFYDGLSPYGQWVNDPTYGYEWVPNAGADFMPYGTNGHWILTEDGWTWVSDYDWGWAPFHYGRWRYDNGYGWMWLPDNVWGPAWVEWRTGGGCYGWTPLGFGIGIGVGFYAAPNYWLFCNQAHFGDPYISRYYLPRTGNAAFYGRTTVIGGTHVDGGRTYYAGPDRAEVERVTHTTINPVAIRSSAKPGSSVNGGALNIYRPAISKTAANGARPAPAHVAALKDVKPVAQRSGSSPAHAATTPQHTVASPLPNANRTQHATTNVPITRPAATQQKAQPQRAPQRTTQPAPQRAASQFPSPYTVHPSTAKPAAAPQRSAAPTPQRSAAPARSAAPQRAAPQQRSAPARSAAPQRSASPPRQQSSGGEGKGPR